VVISRRQAGTVAIAGAGMTGAYLYRRLREQGIDAIIYDIDPQTACGLNPCAWGTSRGFNNLVRAVGLDPDAYILQRSNHVLIDEVRIQAQLMTFDKPALLKELLAGATIPYSPLVLARYDRIIDATGVARAFLPTLEDDVVLPCVQWRVRADESLPNQIQLNRIGYAWCFPLSAKHYHIGCGSLRIDPREKIQRLGWLPSAGTRSPSSIICRCRSRIRLTSPQHSQPFVVDHQKDGIWGVGESIGCVAPLAGDGIVPGMRSVEILLNNWDEPRAYSAAILSEFEWMRKERLIIDKLRRAKSPGIGGARVLQRNSKRMGMQVNLINALKLVSRLNR
jgi:flavin-dependent dehydrogenase